MNYKGQGSLEYLMLIAAAVVVVAIVISFIAGMVPTVQDAGNKQNYEFICNTLNTKTFECGCYLCKNSTDYKGTNPANEDYTGVPITSECEKLARMKNNSSLNCSSFS